MTNTVVVAQLSQDPEDEAASAPVIDVPGSREVTDSRSLGSWCARLGRPAWH